MWLTGCVCVCVCVVCCVFFCNQKSWTPAIPVWILHSSNVLCATLYDYITYHNSTTIFGRHSELNNLHGKREKESERQSEREMERELEQSTHTNINLLDRSLLTICSNCCCQYHTKSVANVLTCLIFDTSTSIDLNGRGGILLCLIIWTFVHCIQVH